MINQFIRPIDLLTYGFILFFTIAATIFTGIYHDNWQVGEIVTLTVSVGSIIVICIIMLLRKYYNKPKWITAQGVGVWENLPWFDSYGKLRLNKAIDIFTNVVSKDRQIPKIALLATMAKLRLEWTTSKISLVGMGWEVQDKYGVQQDNNIMVYWTGLIEDSALVHEMLHFIRTQHCHLDTDYQHEDPDWWYLEAKINRYIRNTVCMGEC